MDLYYGVRGQERLKCNAKDVVEGIIDDNCEMVVEDFDAIADRIKWPIKIHEHKPVTLEGDATAWRVAERTLEKTLEWLDEQYGGEDPSEPTEAMVSAAYAFGRTVVDEYLPYQCEPTGKVIEYTREQARGICERTDSETQDTINMRHIEGCEGCDECDGLAQWYSSCSTCDTGGRMDEMFYDEATGNHYCEHCWNTRAPQQG